MSSFLSNDISSNSKSTSSNKVMMFVVTVAWTIALAPCVTLLVWILKYHLGLMVEPPIVYTNNAIAVTALLYSVFILSNFVYVVVMLIHERRMNKKYAQSIDESNKEDFNQDIF